MNVGERIKTIRKLNGLSQLELANKCGLNRNSIYNYEKGKRHPKSDDLQSIANALNIPSHYLIGNDDTEAFNDALVNDIAVNLSKLVKSKDADTNMIGKQIDIIIQNMVNNLCLEDELIISIYKSHFCNLLKQIANITDPSGYFNDHEYLQILDNITDYINDKSGNTKKGT